MAKKNWFIPSLIIVGLLLIGLSLLISTQPASLLLNQKSLAKAELNLGKAFVIRHGFTKKETLTGRASLYLLDTLETGADGDVTLSTDTGYKIRVPENSTLTLDEEKGRTLVLIKRGEIQFETSGQEGSLNVSRDGNRMTPQEYSNLALSEETLDSLPNLNTAESAPTGPAAAEGLTPEQIQDTLRNNRSAFFRCYTQLLQKTPGITGQTNLSFTIEPSGKISLVNIASSSIQDPQFQRCLTDTLQRISFRPFSGKAISTIFPLKFE